MLEYRVNSRIPRFRKDQFPSSRYLHPLPVPRRGLGELMLVIAVHRTAQDAAAAFALLMDAKNDQAAAFYRRYGFRPLADRPRTLFLPLATAQKTLQIALL